MEGGHDRYIKVALHCAKCKSEEYSDYENNCLHENLYKIL